MTLKLLKVLYDYLFLICGYHPRSFNNDLSLQNTKFIGQFRVFPTNPYSPLISSVANSMSLISSLRLLVSNRAKLKRDFGIKGSSSCVPFCMNKSQCCAAAHECQEETTQNSRQSGPCQGRRMRS